MPKSLRVWVFQTGEPLHIDGENSRPMRAMNLCNALVQKGHSVILWSTDFHHQQKRHRYNENKIIHVSDKFEIRLIKSIGYKKNISLGRLVDHVYLALNLKNKLRFEKNLPDVAFIGYPPIETASVMARWLKQKGVPTLLDVKDQWPSIFIEALPKSLKNVGRLVFWPYFYFARRAMKDVTGISTMAEGFLDWALGISGRCKTNYDGVFPLTVPKGQVSDDELLAAGKWWDEHSVIDDNRPRVFFVGSLSPAFDFKPIYDAASIAQQAGDNVQFIICGEGGSSLEVKSMMTGLSNVIFPGWIDRPKIEVLAKRCIASLAPYLNTNDFILSMPNKIIDALSLGCPILSPLQGEVANLISNNGVGISYSSETGKTLYDSVNKLIQNPVLQKRMSKSAEVLYGDQFSFEIVYSSLVSHLEMLAATD